MIDLGKLNDELAPFFRPRSVAVIGATNNITKWGSLIFGHLLAGGFAGELYPIHPKEAEILGRKVYPRIGDVPGPVDLAFITLPATKVAGALRECATKGVRAAVVITSDFSETGAEGAAREREIVEVARAGGMRIVGPNTMGIASAEVALYGIGAPVTPAAGNISFISQSGNLGTQMLYWADHEGLGICRFVGSGNEADLTLPEYLAWLGQDEATRVILLYVEGIRDGRLFLDVAARVAREKPVLVLKTGRTQAGRRAAASHTGSMAGAREVVEGAFRQAGLIRVDNPTELIELAGAFTHLTPPRGNRVGILTLGGGWGVVTSDHCNEAGLDLPPLPGDLVREFDGLLPPYWSRGNPVDLVGHLDLDIHIQILERMVASDAYDMVITLGSLGATDFVRRLMQIVSDNSAQVEPDARAKIIADIQEKETDYLRDVKRLAAKYGKPIAAVSLESGGAMIRDLGGGEQFVVFPTPERAVKALEKLYEYHRYRQRHA